MIKFFQRGKGKSEHSAVNSFPISADDSLAAYFKASQSWAYDRFDAIVLSRNRYRIAFLVAMGLSFLLALTVLALEFIHKPQFILIHQDSAGVTYLTPVGTSGTKTHSTYEIKSEINRFINYYESFDATSFDERATMVSLTSTQAIFNQYKLSVQPLVNNLSTKGYRRIEVESISLLGDKKNPNQAVVVFATIDQLYGSNDSIKHYYQVYLTFKYSGLSSDRTMQLLNYDGFTVITYLKTSLDHD